MTLLEPQPIPPLTSVGKVHFIAMGGAGMSGVAEGFLERGIEISGCDQADSPALNALRAQAVPVWVGHDPAHLDGVDTVVVSSAIRADNPELVAARSRGLPVMHRSLALATLMAGDVVIAVAGTHGKTTTTAMCVAALQAAGGDPSYVIGGTLLDSGLGSHSGTDPRFVVEADESDGSFRQYPSTIAVVTSVDVDHLDNWGDAQTYAQGFAAFAQGPTVGVTILDLDNPGAARLAADLAAAGRSVVTYGESPQADLRLTEIDNAGLTASARLSRGQWSARLQLALPGRHNLHNAAAALAAGVALGEDPTALLAGLARFHGTARRFQVLGQARGITVVDDYAHHPAEVAVTLACARTIAGSARVIACFQPHLFSRTLAFADDFGQALAGADEVVVLNVYPAREDPIPGVDGSMVARAVADHGGRVHDVPDMADALECLENLVEAGDLVLTIGAGSITQLGPQLLQRLES